MEQIKKEFKNNIKTLVEAGKLEDAKLLLEEYKKIAKEDVEAYSIMGVIAMMEGRMDEAEEAFKVGIGFDDQNFDLHYNLGYLYESIKDLDKAVDYYKQAKKRSTLDDQEKDIEHRISSLSSNKDLKKEIADNNLEKSNLDRTTKDVGVEESVQKTFEKSERKNKSVQIEDLFNSPVDRQVKKDIKNKNYNNVVEAIQKNIKNREYKEVVSICSYWFNNVNNSTGIIYYFMGVAANGMGDFESAVKYHKKALELDTSLADLRNKKSKYKYNYDEKHTDCIGCGNNNYEIVNVSNQSISEDNKGLINPIRIWVKCQDCGLIYVNTIPKEESLNEYYSKIAKEKFGGIYGNIDDRFEFLVSMANKRLEKIEKYTGGAKTILDIGTGIGVFTGTAIDRGWEAEGLEFTPEDCEYAKEKFGLELKQENFYDFKEDRKYDVVTLFEVIEHLHNPLEDLKQIKKLVKDQGILVVATPIQDSLYGKKMKEHNVFWYVVTHLSYFTKQVMVNYLEEAGFEVIEISGSNEGMGRMEFYCRKI